MKRVSVLNLLIGIGIIGIAGTTWNTQVTIHYSLFTSLPGPPAPRVVRWPRCWHSAQG